MCRTCLTLACNWLPSGCPSLWIFNWRTFLQLAGQVHECDFDTNVGQWFATGNPWKVSCPAEEVLQKEGRQEERLVASWGPDQLRELLDPTWGKIWDSSADWRLSILFQEKTHRPVPKWVMPAVCQEDAFDLIARFSALSLHFSLFAYVMTGWYTH